MRREKNSDRLTTSMSLHSPSLKPRWSPVILESLETQNYGPFAVPVTLELDPEVTVLTGANDTGKSSLLRLLSRISTIESPEAVGEFEFNQDNLHDTASNWQERDDFGAVARYQLSRPRLEIIGVNPTVDWIVVRHNIAPNRASRRLLKQGSKGQAGNAGNWPFEPIPMRAIWLPPPAEIRDTIDCAKPNEVEHKLFRVALGREFKFDQLASLSHVLFERQLGQAKENLNRQISVFLPPALGIEWELRGMTDRKGIHCYLKDSKGGYTAFGSRGTGVRRVMAILAWLMAHNFEKDNWLVLFDEPETSLHADSQHFLRLVLENLGAKHNIQVVYATHSPSMINVMRPNSIRLLNRERVTGKATTSIDNRPFAENFFPVRTSLGITPADSLLYASLTVVVEGESESIGLPLLLLKLAEASVPGFERVRTLLSQAHFLDGMGDRYPFICKLAKSQGARVIIFLDGDKKKHIVKHKLDQSHPDVPIVTLADGEEFEQIVPREFYFRALAEILADRASKVSFEGYSQWEQGAGLPEKMMFSKRVDKWLDTLQITEWSKPQVTRRAIELTNVDGVKTAPLLEFVKQMGLLLPV
jgi:predicted ATPase